MLFLVMVINCVVRMWRLGFGEVMVLYIYLIYYFLVLVIYVKIFQFIVIKICFIEYKIEIKYQFVLLYFKR